MVGTPVDNCGSNSSPVTTTVTGTLNFEESWSLGLDGLGLTFGKLRLAVDGGVQYTQTEGKSFQQAISITVGAGKKVSLLSNFYA